MSAPIILKPWVIRYEHGDGGLRIKHVEAIDEAGKIYVFDCDAQIRTDTQYGIIRWTPSPQ